jgi:hypothetical protein
MDLACNHRSFSFSKESSTSKFVLLFTVLGRFLCFSSTLHIRGNNDNPVFPKIHVLLTLDGFKYEDSVRTCGPVTSSTVM